MKFARLAIVVVLAAAFLAGCGKSVVGRWEAKDQSQIFSASLVFNKDKTGNMTMTPNKEKLESMARAVGVAGGAMDVAPMVHPFTWEQDGDKVTVRAKDKPAGSQGKDSYVLDMPDSKTLIVKEPAGKNPPMTFTRE